MEFLDYQMGYDYGSGVYSLNGSVRGDAVDRANVEAIAEADGITQSFFMHRVESSQSLRESLDISASLNTGVGLFRSKASASFQQNTAIDLYSLYLIIRTIVFHPFKQIRFPRLTNSARDLWASGDEDAWDKRFGDGFVRGIATGGAYFAFVRIETKSEEHQQELDAKLSASYGAFGQGVDFKAAVGHSLPEVAKESNMFITFHSIGGSHDSAGEAQADTDSIIDRALSFPSELKDGKGVPFMVMTVPYETIGDLPDRPNAIDLLHAKESLRSNLILRNEYLDDIADIKYVLNNSEQFQWKSKSKQMRSLESKIDDLNEAINKLASSASRCVNNVMQCEMPTEDNTVNFVVEGLLPDRKGAKKSKRIKFPVWRRRAMPDHLNVRFAGLTRADKLKRFPGRGTILVVSPKKKKKNEFVHPPAITVEEGRKIKRWATAMDTVPLEFTTNGRGWNTFTNQTWVNIMIANR